MQIVTHNAIIGSHYWPDAPAKYAYLKNEHRHVFHIRCWFDVKHNDRDIEINDMQDIIKDSITQQFENLGAMGVCFGGMSCEDIATFCIDEFGCVACEVLEDGYGGAYARK